LGCPSILAIAPENIRGRQPIAPDVLRLHPCDLVVRGQREFALSDMRAQSDEIQRAARGTVFVSRDDLTDRRRDPELLAELPRETFLQGLARLDGAAGEFPVALVAIPPLPPGEEHPPLCNDDRRGNELHLIPLSFSSTSEASCF
jgi:hypothetical protein